jgi:hypothetical protein
LAAIGQQQRYFTTVCRDHRFAFAYRIPRFEAPHIAFLVASECRTGNGCDGGKDLGLSHGDTPDTVSDSSSVRNSMRKNYWTKVQFAAAA